MIGLYGASLRIARSSFGTQRSPVQIPAARLHKAQITALVSRSTPVGPSDRPDLA